MPPQTQTPQTVSPQQLNQTQRQLVVGQAVDMIQQVYSGTVSPASSNLLNIQPRNVGLTKKFTVKIVATLTNGASGTATLTDFALANLLQNVTFTDLQNNLRINTTGAHLTLLAYAKRRHPYSATADYNQSVTAPDPDNVSQMLNVPPASWPVFAANPTIAASTAKQVTAWFEVPLAYSDDDLRGSVYLNVVNATTQLGLTFNPNVFAAAAPADYTGSVYQGSAGVFTSAVVTVYQHYLDQLPVNQKTGQVVLPTLDLSTVYELKTTGFNGMTPGVEFAFPYTNFRDFYSTFLVFNSDGTATGRHFGTDLNYLALQSANFTNLWKVDPLMLTRQSREVFGADLPAGTYYVSHRKKPISTLQYGNMELIINPITAPAGAYATIYWESMALLNTITQAGSLASNG